MSQDYLAAGFTASFDLGSQDGQLLPVGTGDNPSGLTNPTTGVVNIDDIRGGDLKDGINFAKDGWIKGGADDYASGNGFFLGWYRPTEKYVFFIGDSTGNNLTWDGSTLAIVGTITATSGAIGGFSLGSDYIRDAANSFGLASTVTGGDDVRFWAGDTFANRATAPLRITESGLLYATGATISGSITATTGTIGGFTISATQITSSNLKFDSANEQILIGSATAPTVGDGVFLGKSTTYQFRAGSISGNKYMLWDGSVFTIKGPVLTVLGAGSEIGIQGWQFSATFSATDNDTVAWTSGTVTLLDGTTYSISSGNTGNMSALTYIYLNIAVSTTVLQTTTTAATAAGTGKILIAVAQNVSDATKKAEYQVFGGSGGSSRLVTADVIAANTVTANEIAANTITASKMNVSQLSAIAADMGAITAGTIVLASTGYIRSGQTAYNTGTGFWLGLDTGTPKFSIGDGAAGNSLTWDGSTLRVNGSQVTNQDIFGDGSDGNVTIFADTSITQDMFYNNLTIDSGFTLNTNGFRVHVKGTLTVNGTIGRPGNNGGNGGNGTAGTVGPNVAGVGGTAGAASSSLASGSMNGAVGGTAGTAGANGRIGDGNGTGSTGSSAGSSVVKSLTSASGTQGGNGGDGGTSNGTKTGGVAGASGAAGTTSGTVFNIPKTAIAAWTLSDNFPTPDTLRGSAGSTGGTGGGGGSTQAGGGGGTQASGGGGGGGGAGSAGGLVSIFARIISVSATGLITARGGNGGNGGNGGAGADSGASGARGSGGGGGGGGAAGSGGYLALIYASLTNLGTISAAAGTPGTGGTGGDGSRGGTDSDGSDGSNGPTGNSGLLVQLQV